MRRHREQRGNKIRRNELDMKEEGKGKRLKGEQQGEHSIRRKRIGRRKCLNKS